VKKEEQAIPEKAQALDDSQYGEREKIPPAKPTTFRWLDR
jgi:hypothetical protein